MATANHQLAQKYQQKTDKQHILENPDTYIGSVEIVDTNLWVLPDLSAAAVATDTASETASVCSGSVTGAAAVSTKKIVLNHFEYIPGLYKLFDEGIVNCRDHVIRMIQLSESQPTVDHKLVSYIHTTVSDDGTIVFENDGNGIDVAIHPENKLWIPEMIFGHLRTSTNYNKDEKKIVGGKNGFGFKLVLIWSTWGKVETVDHIRGLHYTQEFHQNLDRIDPPVIKKMKTSKPFTRVTFRPDYARFGIPNGPTPDMIALFRKRVCDIAAVTDHNTKKIKVTFNGQLVPVKNFQQYVDMYIGKSSEGESSKRVYEEANDRWEYAVALSPTHQFEQISFVNGICTSKGGKHVDYIIGQIVRKLTAYIEKKKKIQVNANTIKEQLLLFMRCDIENPAFDSQTKDFMNTPSNKFGSTCQVSDAFVEKLAKMGVMEAACSLTEIKERNVAAKKTDGTKTRTIRGIANFVDANFAGTQQSKDCVLILCEGLSAMTGVISGLSSEDRNFYGIYPLKGKLLNVRGEAIKKITENKEITDLKKILGLESGKEYGTMDDVHRNLRYSRVMFLTDADLDGAHIKALCVNLFQSEWASLFRIHGFLSFMNTPILRATRKSPNQTMVFYNEGQYQQWKEQFPDATPPKAWTIKYFKGLGTSTAIEFKEYFANKRIINFHYRGDTSDEMVDRVFNKKRADERKTWLENYDKTAYLDTTHTEVQYEDFINKELIHFSVYDCERSIPNMVDGFKTSLRKIMYCAFKRNLMSEVKVAQFSGYVSEHSEYHHGEASLNGAIVGLAQNFVGSNNINWLVPQGQMGTRLHGGEDSASERYIFTYLNPLTRYVFPEKDDAILHYLNEDGTMIEPEYYVPILPTVLMNGIAGIGTGFSSSIPPFSPKDLVRYIQGQLRGEYEEVEFLPYYENFRGSVHKIEGEPNKFLIKGNYEKLAEDKIRITELPVGQWTMPYVTFLEGLADGQVDKNGKKSAAQIKDFVSNSTEKTVDIQVTFAKGRIAELEAQTVSASVNGLEKLLKLTTTVSTTNMNLFDAECKLHKYSTVEEIVDAFIQVRYKTYQIRKEYQIREMERVMLKLSNKAKYIQLNLDGSVDLRRKNLDEIHAMLEVKGLVRLDDSFDYLIKMPMVSVSKENVEKLMRECAETEKELEALRKTTIEQMWLSELAQFVEQYDIYVTKRAAEYVMSNTGGSGATKQKARKIGKK